MKRGLSIFAVACIFLLCITLQGNAAMISGLYNTGVDNNGNVLSIGTNDNHYILSSVPTGFNGSSTVVPVPGAWISPPSGSYWIGPQYHSEGLSSDPAGTYIYKLSFNLTNLNPDTAVITGSWASDNPSEIWLNGVNTGLTRTANDSMSNLTAFSLQTGFVSETNILEFRVVNLDNGMPIWGNPSGLLVSDLQGTAAPVPVPAAVWLFGTGLLGLFSVRRKIRK